MNSEILEVPIASAISVCVFGIRIKCRHNNLPNEELLEVPVEYEAVGADLAVGSFAGTAAHSAGAAERWPSPGRGCS